MVVTVVTSLPAETRDALLERIHNEISANPDLTPRPIEIIAEMHDSGLLHVAFADGELAGWVLSEPLDDNLFELGMTFVKPEFRRFNVFAILAKNAIKPGQNYVLATYSKNMIRFVQREYGFHETTLLRVILKTKGRFLTKRLGASQRKSISTRLKNQKPLFALRDVKEAEN